MQGSISCVILKAKPIDAVFCNTALSNTLRPCGLEFAEGIRSPFAKNRTSFTTSDASDAENRRPAALPYAGCAPYSTGTEKQLSPSRSPQNRPRPRFAPRRPRVAGFHPRWGTDPPPPGQGPVRAPQGRVWQKRKKTAHPGKQPPAQMVHTPALDFPLGEWFPQKPAVVRGVKNKQVKGPGSPTGVPCRVTSPGRAGR